MFGDFIDRFLFFFRLYCFDFDPVGKKYALRALNVMKLGGAITLFAIIIMMGFLWLRKNKGEQ